MRSQNFFKKTGLFLLLIFFSTNYYGGNSLGFLNSGGLAFVKAFCLVTGFLSLLIYLAIKKESERKFVDVGGTSFSKEAVEFMSAHDISDVMVRRAVKGGDGEEREGGIVYGFLKGPGEEVVVVVDECARVKKVFIKGK
ncbi:hypothetical protein [Gilvimarinus agarilyticus]|uniref:hypothetical protein n=1 Tax=Gilvimarinus agarilyticus TaxID=679259 RepID=UPI0005A06A28|nr:hypothetical protein [Gilvimarinus agarilyticus]